jgi:hypothetical protein
MGEVEVQLLGFTSVVEGRERYVSCPGRFTPTERVTPPPGYLLGRGLGGPQSLSRCCVVEMILLLLFKLQMGFHTVAVILQ